MKVHKQSGLVFKNCTQNESHQIERIARAMNLLNKERDMNQVIEVYKFDNRDSVLDNVQVIVMIESEHEANVA